MGLRSYRETNPDSAPAAVVDKLEAATSSLKRYLATGGGKGGAAATADVGGTGPAVPAAACAEPSSDASDAWLDKVNEREHFPSIAPSHYAELHGIEPFERSDLKAWDLHVYPTDDWYERAKKATDRCDLEMTKQWTGAAKGVDDKVVWVTGLFDLKRGESGNKEFQRGMDEYFRRFQGVIDCGFDMIIFMPAQFKANLKLDDKKHVVIDMNGAWYK